LNVPDLHECVPYDCIPIAIERADGAKPIQDFTHPERAFYVFGPEDGSVPKAVQEWCKCVVYIPARHCMNLAATVNVVLFDRAMKRGEWPGEGDV
jgi:tRNA(Leu) C34 or U34 (ribose-2'-O)-methylase TrmL